MLFQDLDICRIAYINQWNNVFQPSKVIYSCQYTFVILQRIRINLTYHINTPLIKRYFNHNGLQMNYNFLLLARAVLTNLALVYMCMSLFEYHFPPRS
jgi:hypothetical protein